MIKNCPEKVSKIKNYIKYFIHDLISGSALKKSKNIINVLGNYLPLPHHIKQFLHPPDFWPFPWLHLQDVLWFSTVLSVYVNRLAAVNNEACCTSWCTAAPPPSNFMVPSLIHILLYEYKNQKKDTQQKYFFCGGTLTSRDPPPSLFILW